MGEQSGLSPLTVCLGLIIKSAVKNYKFIFQGVLHEGSFLGPLVCFKYCPFIFLVEQHLAQYLGLILSFGASDHFQITFLRTRRIVIILSEITSEPRE
jgi:hypothetical protein